MKLACMQTAKLLSRRQAGLSSADGLRLEDHLAGCSSCRSDASLLSGLSQLAGADCQALSQAARQRAIGGALSAAERGSIRPHKVVRPSFVLPFMAASAAAALVGWFALRPTARPAPEAVAASVQADAQSRVVSGEVTLSGTTRMPGQSLLAQAHMHTRKGAVVQLGHATVELRAETAAAWDASERKLELASGSVMVEVDPSKHQAFAVSTQQFLVRVLGTRFEVTEKHVRVLRGRVSVQPTAASEPILLDAKAGETEYRVPQPGEQAGRATEKEVRTPKHEPSESVAALLERARTQLAAHDLREARQTLKLALARKGNASERAEALSLQAEAQLLAGDFGAARDGYLRVVSQLPHEPAAETALYAAARIEAEHGEPAQARALLARYRERYPKGSFLREAERRERALSGAPK